MRGIKTGSVALGVIAIIAILLVAGRLYLPYWVTDYLNARIAELDGYDGSLKDVDIHLWRGAYVVHGLEIHKIEGGLKEPFIAAETIDLSVEWSALLDGAVVAEIDIHNADLNFSRRQRGEGAGWEQLVDAWSPFDINRLALHGGRVAYIDYSTDPNVHLYVDDIDAEVTNLRNVEDREHTLPSDLRITGRSLGGGALTVEGKLDAIQAIPDFDLAAELRQASLPAFNDYANAFAAIDFEKGNLGLFTELAAADGRMSGYVKAVATDISLVDLREQDQNPFNVLWESLVSGFMEIFENQPEDQFAFRVPIEGNLDDPDRDGWAAFLSIFDNAFGQAFTRDTDGNIRFEELLEE
mgnify:CR=1 FL=1